MTGRAEVERAELLRFLVVGGVNFVLTFAVFTVALNVLHVNHLISLLTAWVAGNFLTYVLNFIWVFRPEARFSFGLRFVKYMTAGIVSVGLNLVLLYVLVDIGGHDPFWSQVAIMPVIIMFNFVSAKFWSLRKAGPLAPTDQRSSDLLAMVACVCLAVLVAGVVWASDRGLELTDEAYYLLSAIHPEHVTLYVSAQHWVLAPLWQLTQSLQGFRLIGAAILIGSASVLAIGVARAFTLVTSFQAPSLQDLGMVVAAGSIGALLYVATIAPSPSYNLLGSAGAYGCLGFALLALDRRLGTSLVLGGLAGAALAVCLVCKPAAGVCVGLTVLIVVLGMQDRPRKWAICGMGVLGTLGTVALMVAVQPREPTVIDSLLGGLDLFRMVQTEPMTDRLVRYAATVVESFAKSLVAFWPVIGLVILSLLYPRRWLFGLTLLVWLLNLHDESSYLSGMTALVRMAEAIYVLVFLILLLSLRGASLSRKAKLLLGALFFLPFAATIGTGNALFTQVVIALAPWTVGVAVLACACDPRSPTFLLQRSATALLLILVTVLITVSYLRDPYHLAEPLIRQTEVVRVPQLGTVKVDPQTLQFLDQVGQARQACAIMPGGAYFGMFNLPGLALTLDLVPPVTPWLNNAEQTVKVLQSWSPGAFDRIVVALSADARADPLLVPPDLRPEVQGYAFCGHATVPHDGQTIAIWASPASAG
jgi:putative flippase GtrA